MSRFCVLSAAVGVAALLLAACGFSDGAPIAGSGTFATPSGLGRPIAKGGGRYVVGKPHFTNGRWYYPAEDPAYDMFGMGSWYGRKYHGRRTANGETYDMFALTMAHPTLPMPSLIEVTNLDNERQLVLRLNDRGPFIEDRIAHVSWRAATLLGFDRIGTARVRVRYLGPAPLNGNDTLERRSADQLVAAVH